MTSEDEQLCERADNLSDMIRDHEGDVSARDCLEAADLLLEMTFRIEDLSDQAEEEDSTYAPSRERLKLEEHLDLIEHVMERLDVSHHIARSILKEALSK